MVGFLKDLTLIFVLLHKMTMSILFKSHLLESQVSELRNGLYFIG